MPDLEAAYSFGGRQYEVVVNSAVDPNTRMVWLQRTADYALAVYEALAEYLLSQEAGPLAPYGLMKAVEQYFSSVGRAEKGTRTPSEPEEEPDDLPSGPSPTELAQAHGLRDTDLKQTVPSPSHFKPISLGPSSDGDESRSNGKAPVRKLRPRASTAHLRENPEELEHIRQLKQDHYAWHCQACLGIYEVLTVVPPNSYLTLPRHRRENVQAHHVDHLQNKGVQGASNLLLLCHYHHDLLGDRLTRALILDALRKTRQVSRNFPVDREGTTSTALAGEVAQLFVDTAPFEVPLFFTREHASAWRRAP